ncbi:Uncharacterised protein [Mycobacteroides abscessus subsp. abscessus]|nr:Uncharacterised protein [Mycobacteroides abscessus subsp. abscessus]
MPPSLTRCTPSSPRGDSTATYTWPAGTRMPSVTSLKWWIRPSIELPMMRPMWAGELPRPSAPSFRSAGQASFLSSIMTGPGRSRSRHCSTIFSDSFISSTRMR